MQTQSAYEGCLRCRNGTSVKVSRYPTELTLTQRKNDRIKHCKFLSRQSPGLNHYSAYHRVKSVVDNQLVPQVIAKHPQHSVMQQHVDLLFENVCH